MGVGAGVGVGVGVGVGLGVGVDVGAGMGVGVGRVDARGSACVFVCVGGEWPVGCFQTHFETQTCLHPWPQTLAQDRGQERAPSPRRRNSGWAKRV